MPTTPPSEAPSSQPSAGPVPVPSAMPVPLPTAVPSPSKRLHARRKTIVDQMSTWDPDLLSLSHADLCLMVHESIAQSGLIEQLSLKEDACAQLIRVVSNSYRGNPYHNFHHAFQVGTRGAR